MFGHDHRELAAVFVGGAVGTVARAGLGTLAVADPGKYSGFAGTVFTAETRDFWRESSVSPSAQGYHWNHNGETLFLIGDAMGAGMKQLLTP